MQDLIVFNKKYIFQKTFSTNISKEYVNDSGSRWAVWEMLRESVQNMMDEAERQALNSYGEILDHCKVQNVSMNYSRKDTGEQVNTEYIEFRDMGDGVDFEQIMLIGESGKRGSTFRGQKGEGESLSFLVAARRDIKKYMVSKDWLAMARIETIASNYEVLVFDLYKTKKPIKGTVWRYYLVDEDGVPYDDYRELKRFYEERGDYFPELSKRAIRQKQASRLKEYDRELKQKQQQKNKIQKLSVQTKKSIIIPGKNKPSRLYVRGVYVKDIVSILSYNLQNVEINRDRSMVDDFQILDGIESAFNSEDLTLKAAQMYWENWEESPNLLEYRTPFRLNDNAAEMFRKAFTKVFGKKACIGTDNFASVDAANLGWKVLDLHPNMKELALNIGIVSDKKILGYQGNVLYAQVTDTQRKKLDLLRALGKELEFNSYPVNIAKRVLGANENLHGFYDPNTTEIVLLKATVDGCPKNLIKTYLHECGHGESGAGDSDRGFVSWWEDMVFEMMTNDTSEITEIIKKILEA